MEIFLLGLFAIGYFVLAGADLGTGMLLPFLARKPHDRSLVIAAIAPFFLGNEVWLVATVGLIAGLFPVLEGALLTGLFPVIVALLAGWIIRDMGLWLRRRMDGNAWARFWEGAVVAGSWIVALSWGTAFGAIWQGLPFSAGLLPLAGAVVGAALFALHGAAFARLRLSGDLRARASALGKVPFAVTALLMALLPASAAVSLPLDASANSAWLAITLLIITPFLMAAQAWVWWLFRHRVEEPTYL